MKLNTLSPEFGSKPSAKRVGRGIGSGFGKTSGKGHKGQKARSGGFHKINFEGGQMPIQRRLPKLGFVSKKTKYRDEVTLSEIASIKETAITIETLKAAGIIANYITSVKVILSGEIKDAKELTGLNCTKGAREAILASGGKITE